MLARVNWPQFIPLITSESALAALGLSLRTSAASTVLCVCLGIPLALVLARGSFPGQRILRAFVLLPLVLPPVVGGVALFLALGRRGLVGQYLDRWFGLTIPFSPLAVVLAETFVAMPFLIVTVEGALRAAVNLVFGVLDSTPEAREASTVVTPLLLEAAGILDLFEEIVDGNVAREEKLKGKPAPDTFLAGARKLGLEAKEAAVFEDAVAGVEAGRAGAFGHVVGVDRVDHADALREHGADVVVQDLAELLEGEEAGR
jgi:hypothetical protein